MPRAVIFDLDGVLIDSFHAHYESWQEVAAEHGVVLTEEDFARTFGRTSREIIASSWAVRDLTDARVREIDDRKEARYREIIAHDLPVMDGACELLQALRAAGFRIGVGSSAPPENVFLALERIGRGLFDSVVHGRDVLHGKPDPEVFLLAAARAGAPPARCVVIEDAVPGLEAARRAGMASVALVSTGRTEDALRRAQPTLVARSLRELTPEGLDALLVRARA
jgi:beta-phosphoglucomutase